MSRQRAAIVIMAAAVAGIAGLGAALCHAGDPPATDAAGVAEAYGDAVTATEPRLPAEPPPLVPVSAAFPGAPSVAERLYVSGIVGASFATLSSGGSNGFLGGDSLAATGSAQDSLFTGGGAIGLALPRAAGQVRLEVEGRSRGPLSGENVLVATSSGGVQAVPLGVTATGGWSALANLWRDWHVGDAFGFYGGGGFGAGGYRHGLAAAEATGSAAVNAFAWQVGTGFLWDVNDRVTLDFGYRYFSVGPGSTNLSITDPTAGTLSLGSYSSILAANELLLSLRIYEPFRAWR